MKMNKLKFFFLFIILITATAMTAQDLKVGYLINSGLSRNKEVNAGLTFLKDQNYKETSLDLAALNNDSFQDIDILWYHRPDSLDPTSLEKEIGPAILSYVKKGGKLILSLDAVRLLNTWGVESSPIQIKYADIKDEGFGRKLGFHGFKTHPVFSDLHGGAYIWHSKKDHRVRKLGFFENSLPEGPSAKVIGIDWAYITYHENSKLVWEYSLGKGKILAIGAYTYFSRPNFNKDQLEKFFNNVIAYMHGDYDHLKKYFWTYSIAPPKQVELVNDEKSFESKNNTKALKLTSPEMTLSRSEATSNYWDLPGRRLLLMGKEKGGFDEVWAHPFMAFRDYEVGIRKKDQDSIIWLKNKEPEIYFTPGTLVRKYDIYGETLEEIFCVSVEKPGMVISYNWLGNSNINAFVKAKSNLRLMWPYSSKVTGTIGFQWSDQLNAFLVSDLKTNSMNAIMGFSKRPVRQKIGQFQDFNVNNEIDPVSTNLNQVAGFFEFQLDPVQRFDVTFAAGTESLKDLSSYYTKLSKSPEHLVEETQGYYANFEKDKVQIITPDPDFNEGFRWALAATDQFLVETPGIGRSFVAGYGTTASGWQGGHKISGRPGYAWYFGRDAEWCGFALDAYGDFMKVKEILRTFNKFQNINGKIYHELTTSGSVHYDASDSTPLYILLAAHYLKASGDVDFIKTTWPNIQKAIDYCYSTDTDGDGLIETTNVGHGWVEGGDLFGAHTTFYLAGIWTAALREASFMAKTIGENKLADKYMEDHQRLYEKINADFWNEEKKQYNYGLLKDGTYNTERTMLPAVPIYFNTANDLKAKETVERFSYSDFSTDWGVRIRSEYSEHFSPRGYHTGSVWPLFSGWTSLAEYNTGRYNQGFTHALNNMNVYRNWDLGSVEEVLNGLTYEPSGVCRHQGWSETMVLQPILEGMLGLIPNAVDNSLVFSPRLPWDWNKLEVKNIRVGKHLLHYSFKRDEGISRYDFQHSGPVDLNLEFHPVFPKGSEIHKVVLNGKEIEFKSEDQAEGVELDIAPFLIKKEGNIKIYHDLGPGILPQITLPEIGAKSEGLRIINEKLNDDIYRVVVEGRPGKSYKVKLFVKKKPREVNQAVFISSKGDVYTYSIKIPPSPEKYGSITIDFRVR